MEGFQIVLVVADAADLDAEGTHGIGSLCETLVGQLPEFTFFIVGQQHCDDAFLVVRKEGCKEVRLIAKVLDYLHDLCITLLGYTLAVVQDAVYRALGKAGEPGDVFYGDFLVRFHVKINVFQI